MLIPLMLTAQISVFCQMKLKSTRLDSCRSWRTSAKHSRYHHRCLSGYHDAEICISLHFLSYWQTSWFL